jgi:hypothetical protein
VGARVRAVIVLSSVVPVTVAVCGCGTEVVRPGGVEDSIRSHARVPLRSVSCPSGVEAKVGNTLRCSLSASDGSSGTLTVHITNVSGTTVRWRYGQKDFQQPASGASTRIMSTDGSFGTVVPLGFVDQVLKEPGSIVNLPAFVLAVTGPVVDGYRIRITVFREPLAVMSAVGGRHDIDSVARAELAAVKRTGIPVSGFSPLRSLTVAGASARAVDYFGKPPPADLLLHQSAVVVVHGSWIYAVNFAAPPSGYAAHVGALADVIGGWRWR